MSLPSATQCPCQSGKMFEECCQPLFLGEPAASPEALMRSRYSAFSTGNVEYLLRSWHAEKRPSQLDLPENTHWFGLEITESSEPEELVASDNKGLVTFKARFKENNEWFDLIETSEFERQGDHWFYLDGNAEFITLKPGRNDVCLCGSGRKWKKCCG